jgi:hypothetical protein
MEQTWPDGKVACEGVGCDSPWPLPVLSTMLIPTSFSSSFNWNPYEKSPIHNSSAVIPYIPKLKQVKRYLRKDKTQVPW